MSENKKVKLGLIGLGTVGTGVVKVLADFPDISKIIYDFSPISGSLLTIPTENFQK